MFCLWNLLKNSNVFVKNVKLIVKKLEDITNKYRFPQLKNFVITHFLTFCSNTWILRQRKGIDTDLKSVIIYKYKFQKIKTKNKMGIKQSLIMIWVFCYFFINYMWYQTDSWRVYIAPSRMVTAVYSRFRPDSSGRYYWCVNCFLRKVKGHTNHMYTQS